MKESHCVDATRRWVERVVVALNLCPFARKELVQERIRFVCSEAVSEEALLCDVHDELQYLEQHPDVETTLLIHPRVLQEFGAYLDGLADAEALLAHLGFEGVYQIASFHPDYQFAGTDNEAAENYTNRSPYPMMHLLREQSLEQAIAGYPDIDSIPRNNIDRVASLGVPAMRAMVAECLQTAGPERATTGDSD
ncbi:DUF1415 domain-containing protein [Marinobacter xestospongiae]|uniref:DUF1415 domain-containing protein n=1 Tax=Marinobacter xestospongiae TaxID=994319 RepID=A0ABU3VUE2_9GAMM|nr:DUF1415 domain-containing protein [Marinobacter xestospongiae]MDV2077887.1 DUF1415 domain-containing protein [Marinobacter xestospongiae]